MMIRLFRDTEILEVIGMDLIPLAPRDGLRDRHIDIIGRL